MDLCRSMGIAGNRALFAWERTAEKKVVKIGFCPDNFRWAPDGKILVAGQNTMPGSQAGFRFQGLDCGQIGSPNVEVY